MKPTSETKPKHALATVVDDSFLPGAAVMLHSFLRTNPWFEGDIIVFCDERLSPASRDLLDQMFDRLHLRPVRGELVSRINRIAAACRGYDPDDARFFYLEAFSLRGYEKVLVCDADLLFRDSIQELMEIPVPLVAAKDGAAYAGKGRNPLTFEHCEPNEDHLTDTFNCGFLVLSSELLNDETERALFDRLTPQTWSSVTTKSTDQFLYNVFFAGQAHLVESRYNYVLRHRNSILAHDGTDIAQAKVLHFNLPVRPWNLSAVLTEDLENEEIAQTYDEWLEVYRSALRARLKRGTLSRPKHYAGAKHDLNALVQTHLFVISPNNSGSTFLKNVMAHSARTWNLDREGQYTFGFEGPTPTGLGLPLLWASDPDIFSALRKPGAYDWEINRQAWYFQATSRSPDASVFVEKSPPFVLHVDQLATHFRNAKFIFMVRNPFAVAEGILRRYEKKFPSRQLALEQIAQHLLKCLQLQQENIERFGSQNLWFTYEQMCADPDGIAARIRNFIPELDDLRLDHRVAVKRMYDEPLRDMNADQIARLSEEDLAQLSELFSPHQDLFDSFGYQTQVERRST